MRFGSKCCAGSKSRTWAAIRVFKRSVGMMVIGPMPDLASTRSRPEFFAGAADRRNDADSGDDDPVHCDTFAAISFCTMSATSPTVENGISWPALS